MIFYLDRNHFIVDLFYQNFKGYYQQQGQEITRYPELSVRQIGAEGSYLFNGNKFSAKAAFDLSSIKLGCIFSTFDS